jgi:DNA-binding FadR family transcriptional regulator
MDLVRVYPGKGAFITEAARRLPSRQSTGALSSTLERRMRRHLVEARVVIEGAIMRLAAQELAPGSRAAIESALEAYEERTWDPDRGADWERHDRVHLALAEATGNPLLPRVLEYLLDLIPRSLRDRQLLASEPEKVAQHFEMERRLHRELCDAVLSGKPALAEESLTRQMEYEAEAVREYFGNADTASDLSSAD